MYPSHGMILQVLTRSFLTGTGWQDRIAEKKEDAESGNPAGRVLLPRSRKRGLPWYLLCSTLGFLGMKKPINIHAI